MPFKHLDHRVGACMIAKIRRKIAKAYFFASLTLSDLWKYIIEWISESVNLGSLPLQLRRISCREQRKWKRYLFRAINSVDELTDLGLQTAPIANLHLHKYQIAVQEFGVWLQRN